MSKELIIETHIELPSDYFEEAAAVASLKMACDNFRSALSEAMGRDQAVNVTTRTKRQASGNPRKPRAPRVAANGAAASATAV